MNVNVESVKCGGQCLTKRNRCIFPLINSLFWNEAMMLAS